MPLDETLLEESGFDEALLEPAEPGEDVLRAPPRPSVPVRLPLAGPLAAGLTVDIPYPTWLDEARRTVVGPTPEEAALLEQRALPRVTPLERYGAIGLLSKPTVTLPEWPRLEGDIPLSALPSVGFGALWNALIKPGVESISSPLGAASIGAFGAARLLARAGMPGTARAVAAPAAAAFAAPMATAVPAASRTFGEATVTGGPQEILESAIGAGSAIALPAALVHPAISPGGAVTPALRAPEPPPPLPVPPPLEVPPAARILRPPSVPRPARPRPVVPETPAEPREPVLATIRRADARTIGQIQQLFPKAQLSREQARILRNQAFPPKGTAELPLPVEAPPTVPRGTIAAPAPEPAPAAPAPAAPAARLATELDQLETLADADMATPAQLARLAELRKTPVPAQKPPPEAPEPAAVVEAAPEAPEAAKAAPEPVPAPPAAPPEPELVIPALDMAESDLSPGKLKTLPMRDPATFARLEKYFGVKGVTGLTRRVQERFAAMRAEAEPKPAVEEPQVAPEPPAAAPAPEPAAPVVETKAERRQRFEAEQARLKKEYTDWVDNVMRFLDPEKGGEFVLNDGRRLIVSRDPVNKAHYRVTYVQADGTPTGHEAYSNLANALREVRAYWKNQIVEIRKPELTVPVAPPAVETKLQGEVTTTAKSQGFRAATEVKKELTQRLQQAISDAPKQAELGGKPPTTVTLDIPGDGTFTLVNTKEALGKVLAGAKRLETSAKPSTPSAFTKVRPPTPPKPLTGKERVLRPLARFVSDDPTRFNLQAAWSDGEYVRATNGRMLIRFKQDYGGSKTAPRKFDPITNADVEGAETVGNLLEGMEQIWPKGDDYVPVGVLDVAELFQAARNAQLAFRDSRKDPWVTLHVGESGKVGMEAVVDDLGDEVRFGDTSLPTLERPYNANYLLALAEAASETGAKRVKVGVSKKQGSDGALVLSGDDWDAILMGKAPEKVEPAAEAPPAEQPPMPPGPGAASPLEFEQRATRNATAAAAGQRAPGASPPVVVPPPLPGATPPPLPAAPNIHSVQPIYDFVSPINSPQFTYWFGRLGRTARQAWEKLALGSLEIRESIGRDVETYVDQTLASLPRPYRKAGGRAFFDVLDGRTPEQIEADYGAGPGGAQVVSAARAVKTRLEEIRTTIRDTKRDASRASLTALDKPTLQSMFAETIDSSRDTTSMTKSELADALTLSAYPDDWGFADGSYMPHLFYGTYVVRALRPGEETPTFVLRAETELAAKAAIHKYVRENPESAGLDWTVDRDAVIPGDMVRLNDNRFWRLVSDMKEQSGLSKAEVKAAIQGNIGRLASKQKWWGSLQRRWGYANYERNYRRVMTSYLVGFHRWRVLSRLNREVRPMIEVVKAEGRPNAALGLGDILDYMWGKPSRSTELVDAALRSIPGIREIVKPLFLERATRGTRSLASTLLLRTLRYALVNRIQPLQGLYPLLGERIMVKSKLLQHSAEGKRLLDEANVRFDPGQYGEHNFLVPTKVRKILEDWTGERGNQEQAFLAMYLHARETGLSHADSIPYAKLRGQLLTQFTPVAADIPPIMRGPFTGMLFQYKRFPIKQAELLYHMGRQGMVGGIARWMAVMGLAGGAAYYMRQFWLPKDTRQKLRGYLVDAVGERGADAVLYGLPGLLGTDISTSLTLGDEPWGENIYEKLGRAVAGPTVSLTAEAAGALLTPKREAVTTREQIETWLHRYPSLRPFAELSRITRGDYDLHAPDGERRYHRTFGEVLRGLGAFRSTQESNTRIAADAAYTLDKERDTLKNAYIVALQSAEDGGDSALEKIQQFNARWPEFVITPRELIDYARYRYRNANQTDIERAVGKRYRNLLPPSRTGEEEE